MNIANVKNINLRHTELLVRRIGDIENRECYFELFEYLVKNKGDWTTHSNGMFATSHHYLKNLSCMTLTI